MLEILLSLFYDHGHGANIQLTILLELRFNCRSPAQDQSDGTSGKADVCSSEDDFAATHDVSQHGSDWGSDDDSYNSFESNASQVDASCDSDSTQTSVDSPNTIVMPTYSEVVLRNGQLEDREIDYANGILKRQHPGVDGLETPLLSHLGPPGHLVVDL